MPLNNNVDPTKAEEYGMILPAVISQSCEKPAPMPMLLICLTGRISATWL